MNALAVQWNGSRVGSLVDKGSQLSFRYDEAWLAAAGACALSRQLPLRPEEFSGKPVAVFFGGLLPEADARDQIARNLGISADNDFAMLERIGGECAGATGIGDNGKTRPGGQRLLGKHFRHVEKLLDGIDPQHAVLP